MSDERFPEDEWAYPIWHALAVTLAAPIRKAFQDHLAEHQCWPPGTVLDKQCRTAYDLLMLDPHLILIGGTHG